MTLLQKVEQAKTIISDYIKKYPKICLACSWGKDSMVLLHIARQVKKDISVIGVMTPFKPTETKKYRDKMVRKWNIRFTQFSAKTIDRPSDPEECCNHFKVKPLKKALKAYDAWISGVRKTEGITRTKFKYVEKKDGLVKINPILDFTEKDIWRYLAIYHIPVNPMYKQGYRSLGCLPCSAPEQDENETEREGRWKGTHKHCGECGIHSQSMRIPK